MSTSEHDPAVLNVPRLWRELDDDRGLLADLLRQFRRDYPAQVDQLRQALARADANRVGFHAHKLAGMVGVFSAVAALSAAHRVEDLARAGDLAAAPAAVAALERELARLERALDGLGA